MVRYVSFVVLGAGDRKIRINPDQVATVRPVGEATTIELAVGTPEGPRSDDVALAVDEVLQKLRTGRD